MMSEGEYVFCKWKKRLWPAQILSRSQSSRGRLLPEELGFIRLKIIAENKQVTMRDEHIVPLTIQSIEDIADQLGPSSEAQKVVEELTYRRALRELLEIMKKQATPKSPDSFRRRSKEASTGKGQQEQAPMPQQPLSPRRSPRGTGRAFPDSPARSLRPLETRTNNPPTCKPPSSASGNLPGVRKPACKAGKVLKASKPNIAHRPAAPPQLSQRSPLASKGHRQAGGPFGRNWPVRTSTPDSTSRKRCPRFPPAKGRDEAASNLRRSFLGPTLKGFSSLATSALPAKPAGRKRKKWQPPSRGSRRSLRLEAACSKQVPATQEPPLEKSQCPSGGEPREHRESSLDCSPGELKKEPAPYTARVREGLFPEFVDKEADQASDLSLQLSPVRNVSPSPESKDEEEEEELPSIFLHQEPCGFEVGLMVWCKLPRYPYWPAVVKRVYRKAKKANVVLIEKCMDAMKTKGFSTSFKNLKHFDCKEKQTLIEKARENYSHELNWCISLIADYRIRVGCHSFVGSFLEYYVDDMSSPVRKESFHTLSQMSCPQVEVLDSSGELLAEINPPKQVKKILPDRTRAARDRANKQIVEFIVKAKGADEHLRSILKSQKQSRWLSKSLKTPRYLILETYLEDDYQQDLVLNYLKEVYREVGAKKLPVKNRDMAKFVLEVLFPEAIIYAISAVHQIDYKTAEEKYINGPPVSKREREEFEKEIQEEKQNFAKKPRSHP